MVARGDVKEVCGHTFQGFGAHTDSYHFSYLTAAAAVGMSTHEVDIFIKRLDKVLVKYNRSTLPDCVPAEDSQDVDIPDPDKEFQDKSAFS